MHKKLRGDLRVVGGLPECFRDMGLFFVRLVLFCGQRALTFLAAKRRKMHKNIRHAVVRFLMRSGMLVPSPVAPPLPLRGKSSRELLFPSYRFLGPA